MNVLVISASPNRDGLTAACAAAAVEGTLQAGGHAKEIRLNDLHIGRVRRVTTVGQCLNDHECQTQDDFQSLHARVRQADAYVIVTPVYWVSRANRPRRSWTVCAGARRRVKMRAACWQAGHCCGSSRGSGNGTVTCLLSMERWAQQVRARVFDLLPSTVGVENTSLPQSELQRRQWSEKQFGSQRDLLQEEPMFYFGVDYSWSPPDPAATMTASTDSTDRHSQGRPPGQPVLLPLDADDSD